MDRLCLNDIPVDLFFKYFNETNVDSDNATPVMEPLEMSYIYQITNGEDEAQYNTIKLPTYKFSKDDIVALRPDYSEIDGEGTLNELTNIGNGLTIENCDYQIKRVSNVVEDDTIETINITSNSESASVRFPLKSSAIGSADLVNVGNQRLTITVTDVVNDQLVYDISVNDQTAIRTKNINKPLQTYVDGLINTEASTPQQGRTDGPFELYEMPVLEKNRKTRYVLYNASVLLEDNNGKIAGIYPVSMEADINDDTVLVIFPIAEARTAAITLTQSMYNRNGKYDEKFVQLDVKATKLIYTNYKIKKIFYNNKVQIQTRDSNDNPIYTTKFGIQTSDASAKSTFAYHNQAIRSTYFDIRNLEDDFVRHVLPNRVGIIDRNGHLTLTHYEDISNKVIYTEINDNLIRDAIFENDSLYNPVLTLDLKPTNDIDAHIRPFVTDLDLDSLKTYDVIKLTDSRYKIVNPIASVENELINLPNDGSGVLLLNNKSFTCTMFKKERNLETKDKLSIDVSLVFNKAQCDWFYEQQQSGNEYFSDLAFPWHMTNNNYYLASYILNGDGDSGASIGDGPTSSLKSINRLKIFNKDTTKPYIIVPFYLYAQYLRSGWPQHDELTYFYIKFDFFSETKELAVMYKDGFEFYLLDMQTGTRYKGYNSIEMEEQFAANESSLRDYITDFYGHDGEISYFHYFVIPFDSAIKAGNDTPDSKMIAAKSSYNTTSHELTVRYTYLPVEKIGIEGVEGFSNVGYTDVTVNDETEYNTLLDKFKNVSDADPGESDLSSKLHITYGTTNEYWTRKIYVPLANMNKPYTKVEILSQAQNSMSALAIKRTLKSLRTYYAPNTIVDGYLAKRGSAVSDTVIKERMSSAINNILIDKLDELATASTAKTNLISRLITSVKTFGQKVGSAIKNASNRIDRGYVFAKGFYNVIKYDPLHKLDPVNTINSNLKIDSQKYKLKLTRNKKEESINISSPTYFSNDDLSRLLKDRSAFRKLLTYKDYPLDILYEKDLIIRHANELTTSELLLDTKVYRNDVIYHVNADGDLIYGQKPTTPVFYADRYDIISPLCKTIMGLIVNNNNNTVIGEYNDKLDKYKRAADNLKESSLSNDYGNIASKKVFSSTAFNNNRPIGLLSEAYTITPVAQGTWVLSKVDENGYYKVRTDSNGYTKDLYKIVTYEEVQQLESAGIECESFNLATSNIYEVTGPNTTTLMSQNDERVHDGVLYLAQAMPLYAMDSEIYDLLNTLLDADDEYEWRVR